jgi:8-oxo-dGTP pyrophosphatase MutT (NUDIX family)
MFCPSYYPHVKPFAVFAVVSLGSGYYAATTRAADRGEAGKIGLPGGKVDPGETPVAALIREAAEEGWALEGVDPTPIHAQLVDGRPVQWFSVKSATMLADYKEKGRIAPIRAHKSAIAASGYGNENLNL